MELELFLAPAATFAAVMLLFSALLRPRPADPRTRLKAYLRPAVGGRQRPSSVWRVLLPVLDRFGGWARSMAGPEAQARMRQLLERAGNPVSPNLFLAMRGVFGTVLPLAYLGLAVRGGPFGPRQLFLAGTLAYVGAYLPKMWLDRRAKTRQKSIERSLADALDLIVVSMEAGLAFDAAMAKVAEKTQGPLSQELQRTLREMQLGKTRRDALKQLGLRTGVKDFISLINAIVQADQMGVSMSDLMRTQAAEARTRRRQRAEERAHQASVKMIFPLVLCILPSVMVVTVGPAVLSIYRSFSGGLFG